VGTPRGPHRAPAMPTLSSHSVTGGPGAEMNEHVAAAAAGGPDAPDYSRSTSDSVVVTVPLGLADLDLVRFMLTWENE
jgi:hypothetical protein